MYNHGAAQAVAESAAAALEQLGFPAHIQHVDLDGRPWSWIVPQGGWPDYQHAKIGVGVAEDGKRLWTGIRWDKGLKARARGYIVDRRMLMDRGDWDWERIGVKLPELQEAMNSVKGPEPLSVQISFGNGLLPGFRPFGTKARHTVEWTWQDQRLVLARPVYDIGASQPLQRAVGIQDALDVLRDQTDWDWTWATLAMGWYQSAPDRPSTGARLGRELLVTWLDPLLPFYVALDEVSAGG